MLKSPEVKRLIGDILDSFRIRPNHKPTYIEVADHLTRLQSRQHQVVFGRRGSGKSCLFVHLVNDENARHGILPIYIDVDELKKLGYPDLLIRLLLKVFEALPDARQWWRRMIFHPNDIQRQISDLKAMLYSAEESQVTETEGKSSESAGDFHIAQGTVSGRLSRTSGRQIEFRQRKIDDLERSLVDYKATLAAALQRSTYEAAFVLIDDFYLILRSRQPDVVDYLHRLFRGTDFYIKVGTVRHRTDLLKHTDQTIGVELHQDIEEINLDRTLEDLDATSDYLSKMLESLAKNAGIENAKEKLFNPEAFQSLVLASGGVPRDFLTIFVEAVKSSIAKGQARWVTPTHVWRGAGRLSYRTKLKNLHSEAANEASPLEKVYSDLVTFCLQEKRKTAFLISQDEAQVHPDMHELIQQLMDFKLIHVIEPDTSAASGRSGRYEAYTLDFSLFMEPRRRNIEHVEFWRTDSNHRRIGVREAPDYSLARAKQVVMSQNARSIDEVIADIDLAG